MDLKQGLILGVIVSVMSVLLYANGYADGVNNSDVTISRAYANAIEDSYINGTTDGARTIVADVYLRTQGCDVGGYQVVTDQMNLPFFIKRADCYDRPENTTNTTTEINKEFLDELRNDTNT